MVRASMGGLGQLQAWHVSEPDQQVIEIAEQPAALDADLVYGRRHRRPLSERELTAQDREVHAGVDRELQRAPEAAVHFHQERIVPVSLILLELHHRDAVPAERPQQAHRVDRAAGIERRHFRRARWRRPTAASRAGADARTRSRSSPRSNSTKTPTPGPTMRCWISDGMSRRGIRRPRYSRSSSSRDAGIVHGGAAPASRARADARNAWT